VVERANSQPPVENWELGIGIEVQRYLFFAAFFFPPFAFFAI
jgi:hypothetical protein